MTLSSSEYQIMLSVLKLREVVVLKSGIVRGFFFFV